MGKKEVKYKLTREDSLKIAKIMDRSKGKKYKLMELEGKIILVDGLAVDSLGYKIVEEISWDKMKEKIGKGTINQKEVEDYLHRKYNN